MKEQLISFATAKLAKEKGFHIISSEMLCYCKSGEVIKIIESVDFIGRSEDRAFVAFAPTQSLLQKWLREKHSIIVQVEKASTKTTDGKLKFYCVIHYFKSTYTKDYEEWEDALEAGLVEALKLIENETN